MNKNEDNSISLKFTDLDQVKLFCSWSMEHLKKFETIEELNEKWNKFLKSISSSIKDIID